MSTSYGKAMQVLSCPPAQVRDSFSLMRGESSRGLDTDLYGETNEKDSRGAAFPLADPSISGQLPARALGNLNFHVDDTKVLHARHAMPVPAFNSSSTFGNSLIAARNGDQVRRPILCHSLMIWVRFALRRIGAWSLAEHYRSVCRAPSANCRP
jgi:hypothetical protein